MSSLYFANAVESETPNSSSSLFWPLLRSMKNTENLNGNLMDAINRKTGQSAEYELACVRLAAGSPVLGEICEQIDLTMDGKGDSARGGTATVFFNVIANIREIANGRIRPTNVHQPGYRSSIIFRTSA
jgi:hypothetical protein